MLGMPQQWPVFNLADCLRIMPPGALQGHNQSESCCGRIPAGLHYVPQYQRLDSGDFQSQRNKLPAHRCACEPAMLGMPQKWSIFRLADNVRVVPPGSLQRDNQSQSCRRGFPAGLFTVPQNYGLDAGDVQPQRDKVSSHRSARQPAMLGLPQQWSVFNPANHLRIMPSESLSEYNQSKPCCGRIPSGLHPMPQHSCLDAGNVQSQCYEISAHWSTCEPAMLGMPQQWSVFNPADHLCIVPSEPL